MNKTKRIATAVVSIVLASTMLVGITACDNSNTVDSSSSSSTTSSSSAGGTTSTDSSSTTSSSSGSGTQKELYDSQTRLTPSTDSNGNLTYASGTALNMNVGYNTKNDMSISYTEANFSGSVTLPDNQTYIQGSLKPAWQALQDKLDVTFTDGYTNLSASSQITEIIDTTLTGYNVITAQSSTIVTAGTEDKELFLDLSMYLDYMPNYKKFLQDNPIVYMSLTSDVDSGAMYYAPYFDGNDDIEKYELTKLNWAERVLDKDYTSSSTITFADSVSAKSSIVGSNYGLTSTSSSVDSFMGTTGSWWVECTDPDDANSTVTVVVNYDDALAAAKDSSTELGAAMAAVSGVNTSSLTSGNIVDLQNAAIDATNGTVTGAQLTEILRAYVKTAYQDEDGKQYYTTLSDVINGADAAWDVDLLVGLMRCIVTFGNTNLGTDSSNSYIYGITGRENTSQRLSDMYSLAGELYGVRGFTSRYNFTYIDENGTLQEARAQEETYDALEKMHAMVQEGLVNATGTQASGKTSYYTASNVAESYMIYDYVQTQTANGGYAKMGITSISTLEEDYDFEPIVTPVSKWDDGTTETTEANVDGITYKYDSDGNKYMRFTESWRSVKNTGFCVPYDSVKNDPDKLAAVLAFIDYFYSNDGQMLMTFGGQSTNGNNTESSLGNITNNEANGWWYGNEVTDVDIADVATLVGGQYYINDEYAAQYFCYNNTLYTGTYYNGRQYPTMTNANLAFYYGYSVNGTVQASSSGFSATGVLGYTNYARRIIGSALPIGNKLQAFEYQCTSDQGIAGADKVADGLVNGTISHVYLSVGAENGKGYWYTIVPTTLPYSSRVSTWMSSDSITSLENSVFANASGVNTNFFIDIIFYGYGSSQIMTYVSESQTVPASAKACIELLESYALSTYIGYMQTGWNNILEFYSDYIIYLY